MGMSMSDGKDGPQYSIEASKLGDAKAAAAKVKIRIDAYNKYSPQAWSRKMEDLKGKIASLQMIKRHIASAERSTVAILIDDCPFLRNKVAEKEKKAVELEGQITKLIEELCTWA